ncbi:MAG: hypothetical protein ACR2QM_03315 [Longimicrobiales bacterium]
MHAGPSLFVAALLSITTAACQTGTRLPDEFLGRWYHLETSGGIQGETVQERTPGWIVITAENQIQHHAANGTLTSTEAFELSRGSTIFSAEDGWILGTPRQTNQTLAVTRTIWLAGETLTIADNVYDGFGSTYARDR